MQRILNVGVVLLESYLANAQNPVTAYTPVYKSVLMYEFAIKLLKISRIGFQEILVFTSDQYFHAVENNLQRYGSCFTLKTKYNEVADIFSAKSFIENRYQLNTNLKIKNNSYYDDCCFVVLEACRPLTSKRTVAGVYEKAILDGAAVSVLPYENTLVCGDNEKITRELKDKKRFNYWNMSNTYELQFPQAYMISKLNKYKWDDSMQVRNMVELMDLSSKNPISIVDGSAYAFKVITNLDFEILLGILQNE